MIWSDEAYLLSKRNYDENSIIIDVFTSKYGKCSGIVYGGSSSKQKKNFQIGNKIYVTFKSKSENKIGYFTVELIKPVSPFYFDDKKKSICILSAASILKILLPDNQNNKKIYNSFENLLIILNQKDWIKLYIFWEIFLVKELGFEINKTSKEGFSEAEKSYVEINEKFFKIPNMIINKDNFSFTNADISSALSFNKNILFEHFIIPNKLRFPLSRNILQKYYFEG
jgi:DNA repair protein RecO (recombination protein O)